MKHLFVDTNIYLSFYHYSSDDLNRLQAISGFIEAGEIKLYANSQVKDEFYRNREEKLSDAIKLFSVPSVRIPRVFDQYDTTRKEFTLLLAQIKSKHAELLQVYKDDLENDSLAADTLVNELLSGSSSISQSLYLSSKKRISLGNPPGKRGSIGDAIHWEYLLSQVPDGSDLAIVSADGDWTSPLIEGKLHGFLLKEWVDKKSSQVVLYRSMNDYFKNEFPDIKLEGEFRKDILIQKLNSSSSFDESRGILRKLAEYHNDFSDDQIAKIIRASINNTQVHGAHEYSPDKIGHRLWSFIGTKDVFNVDKDEWIQFCKLFPKDKPKQADEIDFTMIPF